MLLRQNFLRYSTHSEEWKRFKKRANMSGASSSNSQMYHILKEQAVTSKSSLQICKIDVFKRSFLQRCILMTTNITTKVTIYINKVTIHIASQMASRKKADEEKLKRRRLAKFRFKRLVHVVICNRYWIAEIEDREIGNNVHRNVAVIDRRLTHKGTLSIIEKKILNSPPAERTENKRHLLKVVLRKIECLQNLSLKQLDDIAGCARFEYFGPGRVILREGQQPHAVYFLANGEIVVSRLRWDKIFRTYNDTPCGTRTRGQMFGEIALLHDCLRTATCSTATDCELLCLSRKDFDRILKHTLLERWLQLELALERFDYFKYWTTTQVRECCLLSRIVTFQSQQKLPMDVDKGYAYFVLSGQCMILQCLTVSRRSGSYILLPIATNESFTAKQTSTAVDDPKLSEEQAIEHRFIDVGTFSCGSVFGLGEAMPHRMVVARNQVQCLMIPRDWLFEKQQNVGNAWHRVRMKLDMTIQRDRLFELFMRDQHWQRYRKTLVREFVRRNRHQNCSQFADVPIMCRIEQAPVERSYWIGNQLWKRLKDEILYPTAA